MVTAELWSVDLVVLSDIAKYSRTKLRPSCSRLLPSYFLLVLHPILSLLHLLHCADKPT